MPARLRTLVVYLSLFAAYVLAARVGLRFADVTPGATAIWPPTGIAIAAIVILGPTCWPAIFAGAFAANMMTAGSALTSLGIASGERAQEAGFNVHLVKPVEARQLSEIIISGRVH